MEQGKIRKFVAANFGAISSDWRCEALMKAHDLGGDKLYMQRYNELVQQKQVLSWKNKDSILALTRHISATSEKADMRKLFVSFIAVLPSGPIFGNDVITADEIVFDSKMAIREFEVMVKERTDAIYVTVTNFKFMEA